jgi:hypothetical protein
MPNSKATPWSARSTDRASIFPLARSSMALRHSLNHASRYERTTDRSRCERTAQR